MENAFGSRRVPILGISTEQLILILYPTCLIPVAILLYLQLRRQKQAQLQPSGCRRLGLGHQSNISDEFDDHKYARGGEAGQEASGEPRWKVKGVFIYPVKSCGGIEVNEAELDGSGLLWDRKFVFAELLQPPTRLGTPQKNPEWTIRTLRAPGFEKLAHVHPEVWLPDSKAGSSAVNDQGVLIIKYPNIPSGPLAALDRLFISFGLLPKQRSFQVPLMPPADHKYPVEDLIIWKDIPKWLNYSIHVPDDFKSFIGAQHELTLFRVDPGSERLIMDNAPTKDEIGYQPIVGTADAHPIHLLNLASVRDVAGRVRNDIPHLTARRFRPNILLTGPPAYDEDTWKRMKIGGDEYYSACHTLRCRLPNVDPDTAIRHPVEPDKTLKSFRCVDAGDPHNASLGLQLVPKKEKGARLKVGDGVEVLERGELRYNK